MGSLASINIRFFADLKDFSSKMQNSERQIKKMGRSLKKVGKNLTLSVTTPILALGGASLMVWDKQAKAIAQVEQGLKTTGDAVGYTSAELQKMASDLQNNSLFGDEEILKSATAQLLTFTNITQTQFARTQQAALDLATRLDGDLKSASIQLGKALNDPVANLSALSRSGIQFSEDQKKTINALAKTNRLAEAQTIILDELEKQYGGSAAAAAKAGTGPLKQLSNSIGDLTEDFGKIISEAIVPLVDYVKNLVFKFKNLDEGTKRIIVKVGALAAAVGPLLISVGYLATNVIPGLIKVFGVLRAAMMTNPWLLLGGAVIAVIAAFVDFGGAVDNVQEKYATLNKVRDDAAKSIAGEKAKLSELLSIARDENLSKGIRLKAIKDLNKLSPKYLGNLTLETINTDKARQAVDLYTQSLIASAKAKAASRALEELQTKIIEEELNFHKEKEAILTKINSIGIQTSANDERGAQLILAQGNLLKEKEALMKANLENLNKEAVLITEVIKKNQQNASVIRSTPAPAGITPSGAGASRPEATAIDNSNIAGVELEPVVSPLDGVGDATTAELEQITTATSNYAMQMENLQAFSTAVGSGVSDAFSNMSNGIVSSLNLANDGFGGFIKGMIKTVTKLIAMMLSSAISQSIAGATASGTSTGPAAVFTTPAFIATAVGGVLSAFASIPKFATGGIMGGTSFFGDKLLARINSGEMILNQQQQYNLAGMLQPVASQPVIVHQDGVFRLDGNDLVLSLERTNKRNNRVR